MCQVVLEHLVISFPLQLSAISITSAASLGHSGCSSLRMPEHTTHKSNLATHITLRRVNNAVLPASLASCMLINTSTPGPYILAITGLVASAGGMTSKSRDRVFISPDFGPVCTFTVFYSQLKPLKPCTIYYYVMLPSISAFKSASIIPMKMAAKISNHGQLTEPRLAMVVRGLRCVEIRIISFSVVERQQELEPLPSFFGGNSRNRRS